MEVETIVKETMKDMTPMEKAEFLAVLMKGGKRKSSSAKRKTSINGAPLDIVPEVTEKDGCLVYKHADFKSGKRGGYAIADLKEAHRLIETEQFSDKNVKTGTKFVNVNGVVIGENLVKYAEEAGFLTDEE